MRILLILANIIFINIRFAWRKAGNFYTYIYHSMHDKQLEVAHANAVHRIPQIFSI